ncbi:hypothetical protein [Psychrobacillus soli]|uniref:Uncharacterized protein n=1 Tax=Psychrobacillus soli TaxID=1543965 RepID=A0A544T7A4_9BACI|nr:hypothetical protein [Psychrobacillus soli]TQR13336.1 hypothetical protein FG383_12455 [Psychrobacillus soli]
MNIKAGKRPVVSEPELYASDNQLVIINKKCCDSHFKVTELDKHRFIYKVFTKNKVANRI